MKPPNYSNLPSRFWDKVEVNEQTGCWEWMAGKTRGGYGGFGFGADKKFRSHRLSAADFYGPIPDGLFALHHCDARACVRPKHLYYGTHQDNSDDKVARGRHSFGTRRYNSILTDEIVLSIRQDYAAKNYNQPQLAAMHGVALTTINQVILRHNWSHV